MLAISKQISNGLSHDLINPISQFERPQLLAKIKVDINVARRDEKPALLNDRVPFRKVLGSPAGSWEVMGNFVADLDRNFQFIAAWASCSEHARQVVNHSNRISLKRLLDFRVRAASLPDDHVLEKEFERHNAEHYRPRRKVRSVVVYVGKHLWAALARRAEHQRVGRID